MLGPFRKKNGESYRLKLPFTMKIQNVFHLNVLKLVVTNEFYVYKREYLHD